MESRNSPTADVLVVAHEVAAIVRRATRDPHYRVFLFGSHAAGDAGPRSDIDIGIEGPAPVDGQTMQEIREACERLPTLRTIDLVDFARSGREFRLAVARLPLEPNVT